ncbi:hypothetical protein INT43_007703 [Umbelopsis isabellina]|uniref:LIM zinc-binding domain-containing protein n=1 Tax=Mortierella isabellina TaxID=91625 RepID=A0A8H7PN22_MORIS|nr:hypothetical protein INT43_007703 [Umbelopsis isabellina]
MSTERTTQQINVQRVTVNTSVPFDTVLAKLYSEIGGSESVSVPSLIQGTKAEFEKKAEQAAGHSDFMLFQTFNHGAWLKLCNFTDRKIVQIILGLHIPPRMILIENEEKNGTQIVYDLPSTLVASQHNSELSAAALALDKKFEALADRIRNNNISTLMPPRFGGAPKCPRCDKFVYMAEQVLGPNSVYYHKLCFTCKECNKLLDSSTMAEREGQPYCKTCYNRMWGPKGYGSGGRSFLHTETKTAREVLAESDWAAERAAVAPAMSSPVMGHRGQTQADQFSRDDSQASSPAPALPARPSNSPALPARPSNSPSLPTRPAVSAKTHSTPPAIPPKPSNVTSTDRPSAYLNSRTGYVPKKLNMQISGDLCAKCNKPVYAAELVLGASKKYHKMCLRCSTCNKLLDSSNMVDKDFTIYCRPCHSKAFGPKGYGYGGLLSTEGSTR